MHETTFPGLASAHVYDRVPQAARLEYCSIVTRLEHGTEWRMIGGKLSLTAAGLARVADELDALGHGAAALVVRSELQAALRACERRSTPAAAQAEPVDRRSRQFADVDLLSLPATDAAAGFLVEAGPDRRGTGSAGLGAGRV